ncbi:MAG: hypothetical protein R3B81_04945 [bacterium]
MKPHESTWSDTSPEASRVLAEIYRKMPAWRKLQLVEDANRTARELTMAGLRSRYPEESDDRLWRRYLELTLGEELTRKVYGPASER